MADPNNVKSIFLAASEKPPAERSSFLEQAVAGDVTLRRRVEALLRAHENPDSFLQEPAAAFGATIDLSPAEAPLAEQPGTLIGPYKLLEQIGEGGMGMVYMADQQSPVHRRVALKIIKAGMDTRQVIARFEAERQALALMDHSNIARVLDAGATDSGRPYFVMELVRGIPITEYCDQNNLPVHERLELFVQVCHAVQHAHQKGIIHRDLKPSNVLVTLNDGRAVPKVIDFGVAKATGQQLTEKTLFTAFAQLVGTPLYMSPEQAEMTSVDIDTRSDIYSLGVLLYELLTGTTPFDQERMRSAAFDEIRRIIREEEPPTPSTRLSTLGETRTTTAAHRQVDAHRLGRLLKGDLDWIVMKALEKDRARRYDTATGLAEDIQRYLTHQAVDARPATRTYRLRKFVRRNKVGVMAGSAIVAALVAGLALAIIGFVQARSHAAIARKEAVRSDKVAKFFKQMLMAAGPSVARGRDATILREILAKTALQIDADLKDQPEVQGDLWYTIGGTYREIGDVKQANKAYQNSVDSYRLALGNENAKLALALGGLGPCQSYRQNIATGKANAQLGLDIARKCGDADTLASCLVGVALSFGAYGKISSDGELYWREALALRKQLGDDPAATARCMYGLAASLDGESEEAEILSREVLALYRQHPGTDSPKYADALFLLGQKLSARGKPEEAEIVLRKTRDLYRNVYDANHPYQPIVVRFLVQVLEAQGKGGEAESLIREQLHTPPSDANFDDFALLGALHTYRGQWAEASAALMRALELKPNNTWLAMRLSAVLLVAGNYDGYRSNRHRLLNTPNDYPRERMLATEALLVLPIEGADFDRACNLADEAATTAENSSNSALAFTVKALAEYRRGQFESACDWTERALNAKRPSRWGTDYIIRAGAYAKLGQMEAARDSLAKSREHESSMRLTSVHQFWDGDWYSWIFADCLRQEVAALIAETFPAAEQSTSADKRHVDDKTPNTNIPSPLSPPTTKP